MFTAPLFWSRAYPLNKNVCYFKCLAFINTFKFSLFIKTITGENIAWLPQNIPLANFPVWTECWNIWGTPCEGGRHEVLNIPLFVSCSPLSNCNAEKSQAATTPSTPPPPTSRLVLWANVLPLWLSSKNPVRLTEGYFYSVTDDIDWY